MIRLTSSPSGYEHFEDRPPYGVDSKGDFLRAGSILRNAAPQFGKPKGARVGTDDFLIKYLSAKRQLVRGPARDSPAALLGSTPLSQPEPPHLSFQPLAARACLKEGAGLSRVVHYQVTSGRLNIYRLRLP